MTLEQWVESFAGFYESGGLSDIIAIFLFRTLPFLIYALFRARRSAGSILVVALLSSALLGALAIVPAAWLLNLVVVCIGLLYFVLLTVSVHFLALSPASGLVAKLLLFSGLFALCVIVPARALPVALAPAAVIVAHGFELTLAGYSYCCATWSGGKQPTLRDGLFFMLVTPELVFPVRGEASQGGLLRGAARALAGMALMSAVIVLKQTIEVAAPPPRLSTWNAGLLAGAVAFVLLYASHSALAHLQIGLCRVVGYRAPERYHFPFAAVSPRDFWNRWNRYIGLWLSGYIFTPLARAMSNRTPRMLKIVVTTVGAFLLLGAFHDAYWLVAHDRIVVKGMAGFATAGLIMCLWRPLDALIESGEPRKRAIARGISRLGFACTLCISFWIFL